MHKPKFKENEFKRFFNFDFTKILTQEKKKTPKLILIQKTFHSIPQ
jgi:hypothetical protein